MGHKCPFCGGTKTRPFMRSCASQHCHECSNDGMISDEKIVALGIEDFVDGYIKKKKQTKSNNLKEVNAELLAALEAWEKAIPRIDEFASVSPDSLRGKALSAIAKAKGQA